MTTDTSLVAALWRFVENSGTTEEFFELRGRVRQHGSSLYDSAADLLEALQWAHRQVLKMAKERDPDQLGMWDAIFSGAGPVSAAIAKARGQT
jgi:hypothetical protein